MQNNFYPSWLNAAYYQNIPHNEVNWAQLAQQWISMRDQVLPTPSAPLAQQQQRFMPSEAHQSTAHMPMMRPRFMPPPIRPPMPPLPLPVMDPCTAVGMSLPFPQESAAKGFPTPRAPLFPRPPAAPQSGMPSRFTAGLLPTPMFSPRPPPSAMEQPCHPQFNNVAATFGLAIEPPPPVEPPRPLFPSAMATVVPHVKGVDDRRETYEELYNELDDESQYNEPAEDYEDSYEVDDYNSTEHDPSWQPPLLDSTFDSPTVPLVRPPMPVAPPHVYQGFYDDPAPACYFEPYSAASSISSFLDAQQRQKLPAWIREGLEKMEKEKHKNKDKEESERLEDEAKEQRRLDRGKGRFESDSEEDDDDASASDAAEGKSGPVDEARNGSMVDYESSDEESEEEDQKRVMLLNKLKTWLTEILMDVTGGEINRIASKVYGKYKKRAQPQVLAQSSAALATIISLGTGDNEEEEEEVDQSGTDNETTDQSDSEDVTDRSNVVSSRSSPMQNSSSNDSDPFKRPFLPTITKSARITTTKVTSEAKKTKEEAQITPATENNALENASKSEKDQTLDHTSEKKSDSNTGRRPKLDSGQSDKKSSHSSNKTNSSSRTSRNVSPSSCSTTEKSHSRSKERSSSNSRHKESRSKDGESDKRDKHHSSKSRRRSRSPAAGRRSSDDNGGCSTTPPPESSEKDSTTASSRSTKDKKHHSSSKTAKDSKRRKSKSPKGSHRKRPKSRSKSPTAKLDNKSRRHSKSRKHSRS